MNLRNREPTARWAALVFVACVASACASSATDRDSPEAPEVVLGQQFTGAETLFLRGPVPLTFSLTIRNPLDVPVTLRRVELRTQGQGGYTLRAEAPHLDKTIPAGGEETIQLHTWGRSSGGIVSRSSPVSLLGTAVFDSPRGDLARVFTAYLPQPG